MARTNQEIDKMNEHRATANLEKLPYEITETPEQIAEKERIRVKAEADQKEIDAKAAADKLAQDNLEKENAEKERIAKLTPPPAAEPKELNDDELLTLLKSRGISASSLDELKPQKSEADKVKEAEQREADKVAYGLKNGVFTKKEYDSYNTDINDAEEVVFNDFAADALAAEPELKPEEIREMFEAKFNLTEEDGSAKRKRGEKELGIIAEKIIQKKHSKILSLDTQFEKYEATEKEKIAENNKILASAPVYKKDVEDVFNEIKTMKISLPTSDATKTEDYDVEIPTEVLESLKNNSLRTEYAAEQIKAGYDKGRMKAMAELAAVKQSLNSIVKQVVDKALIAHAAGTRGIPGIGDGEGKTETKKLSPVLQDELDRKLGKGKYAETE